MIEIESIEQETSELITTKGGKEYRRYSSECWEESYGSSWETVYYDDELEKAYLEFKRKMVNVERVKELRERAGTGMMECKKALYEANGDMEMAMEILRDPRRDVGKLITIQRPRKRELTDPEHLLVWEAIHSLDPIDEWNNQMSYTEVYDIDGSIFHVHYIAGVDVPMIEEIYE